MAAQKIANEHATARFAALSSQAHMRPFELVLNLSFLIPVHFVRIRIGGFGVPY